MRRVLSGETRNLCRYARLVTNAPQAAAFAANVDLAPAPGRGLAPSTVKRGEADASKQNGLPREAAWQRHTSKSVQATLRLSYLRPSHLTKCTAKGEPTCPAVIG